MRRTVAAIAIAALTLLAPGCDADSDDGPDTATKPSPTTPTSVVVPDLDGSTARDARAAVRELGLHARVIPGAETACVPAHEVIRQKPPAGTEVATGSRVRIRVNVGAKGQCGLDLPRADADLRGVAKRFVALARSTSGGADTPIPVDTPVELFVGGVRQRTIPAERAAERSSWQACPGDDGVDAALGCPVSVLRPFRTYPGPIAATGEPPAHSCLRTTPLPDRLDVYRSVTLTPDEERDCSSYFAVQLFVNDVGQIVAANLVVSEP